MTSNSIVVISEDEILAKALRVKLAVLREVDSIKIAPYRDAVFEIESNVPDVVIVCVGAKDVSSFDFVKSIKATAQEYNSPILIVSDSLDEDFVVNGFDIGVDSFVSIKNSDAEILTSILSCLKKNEVLRELSTKNKILVDLNVIQEETGFYLKEYARKVFESEIQSFQKLGQQAVFMIVSADINCKTQLAPANLGALIKKCTRFRDKIGFCSDDKFYVLLAKADSCGAIAVYERMKTQLEGDLSVSVGACEVGTLLFDDLEKNVNKSISEALEMGNSIVVYDAKEMAEPLNWLDNEKMGQKNFKFFQAAFLKKLENVITPVFYQVQQIWEDKLFNTQIFQSCGDYQSSFTLKCGQWESVLKITYPGFAKINVDFIHNFSGVLPKERISLDLSEIDDTKLNEILTEFIKDFQRYTKDLS